MKFIADANVLFSLAEPTSATTDLVNTFTIKLLSPDFALLEMYKYKQDVLDKSGLHEFKEFVNSLRKRVVFDKLLKLLSGRFRFVSFEKYAASIPEAKQFLRNHTKDEDFIALCLTMNLKLWMYEKLLLELGFGISTKELDDRLSS